MDKQRAARRRTVDLVRDIRQAILDELRENGYDGVTFEGVARRAKTSKPVIYRRYRSRAHMALDAWTWSSPLTMPSRTTGSLRGDLIAVMESLQEYNRRAGAPAFRRMIAEADDALMLEMTESTADTAREAVRHFLAAARDRGEIGEGSVSSEFADLPIILFRHDVFFRRPPYSQEATEQHVDNLLLPIIEAASKTKISAR